MRLKLVKQLYNATHLMGEPGTAYNAYFSTRCQFKYRYHSAVFSVQEIFEARNPKGRSSQKSKVKLQQSKKMFQTRTVESSSLGETGKANGTIHSPYSVQATSSLSWCSIDRRFYPTKNVSLLYVMSCQLVPTCLVKYKKHRTRVKSRHHIEVMWFVKWSKVVSWIQGIQIFSWVLLWISTTWRWFTKWCSDAEKKDCLPSPWNHQSLTWNK